MIRILCVSVVKRGWCTRALVLFLWAYMEDTGVIDWDHSGDDVAYIYMVGAE